MKKDNSFLPITWEQFEEKPVQPIEWLIENIIPTPSLVLIASQSGVGKTLVALELVKHLADGTSFLEEHMCKSSNLLFVDGESGESELKRRCLLLGYSELENKSKIHFANSHGLNLNSEEDFNQVYRYVEDNDIKVVIIDTLRPFSGQMDENNAKSVRSFMQPFIQMRDELGITIIFLDHERKNGQNEIRYAADQNRVLGSQDKIASVDIALSLHRNKEGVLTLKHTKVRIGKKPDKGVLFTMRDVTNADGETRIQTEWVDDMQIIESLDDEITNAAENLLREVEQTSTAELTLALQQMGFGKTKVEQVLKKATEEGRLVRFVQDGDRSFTYQLPAHYPPIG